MVWRSSDRTGPALTSVPSDAEQLLELEPPRTPIGLRTTGREFRSLLDRSGARHRTEGAEKLDFLIWLADQVKGSIEEGRRMNLTVSDLATLLEREGMGCAAQDGTTFDVKLAIGGLLALRRREIARLSHDSSRMQSVASCDESFEHTLALMPIQQVNRCFDIVVYEASAGKDDSPLPGQIASPRERTSPTSCSSTSPVRRTKSERGLRSSAAASPSLCHARTSPAGERSSGDIGATFLLPPPPPPMAPPPAPATPSSRTVADSEAESPKRTCAMM
eukprot:TRINITY_DN67748_c0_g1_i1.p1 TRINITY_DN67748_c0_g1~~TRINITY_DN67748_c0_g1_i1.p1  ORF type:complete len:276 (+),score=41.09 TRINITY_DN67748_c0_g1_i1:189-1016(+)